MLGWWADGVDTTTFNSSCPEDGELFLGPNMEMMPSVTTTGKDNNQGASQKSAKKAAGRGTASPLPPLAPPNWLQEEFFGRGSSSGLAGEGRRLGSDSKGGNKQGSSALLGGVGPSSVREGKKKKRKTSRRAGESEEAPQQQCAATDDGDDDDSGGRDLGQHPFDVQLTHVSAAWAPVQNTHAPNNNNNNGSSGSGGGGGGGGGGADGGDGDGKGKCAEVEFVGRWFVQHPADIDRDVLRAADAAPSPFISNFSEETAEGATPPITTSAAGGGVKFMSIAEAIAAASRQAKGKS
jgi:hypothetical protein